MIFYGACTITCLSKFILPVNFFFYLLLNITSGAENKNEQILKLKIGFLRVRIESPSIIRITLSHGDSFSKKESLSVLRQDETAVWQKTDMTGLLLIRTDSLLVEISKENGTITFRDRQKKKILEAAPCTESSFVPAVVQGENVFNIRQNFLLSKEEALYGLGEFEDAVVNWRNHDVLLEQANRTDINPFLVSTNGYGLFWDNYSSSKFHDGEDGTYFWSQVADQIDYYFVSGKYFRDIIKKNGFLEHEENFGFLYGRTDTGSQKKDI